MHQVIIAGRSTDLARRLHVYSLDDVGGTKFTFSNRVEYVHLGVGTAEMLQVTI